MDLSLPAGRRYTKRRGAGVLPEKNSSALLFNFIPPPKKHMLDFRSLHLATASLAEALEESRRRPDDKFVRDASIQRFEYTYELCVKSLRRQLEAMSDSPAELDALGYRDMIRAGVERGLITAEADWFRYRELRNVTAHVYDPAKAAQVFAKLPLFLRDAEALRGKLMTASA